MKTVTILLLLLLASSASGQLTKEDLRTIIKEEVRPIIKEEIAASEKRTREYIDLKINALDDKLSTRIDALDEKIDNVEKNLSDKIDTLDKSLNARIGNMWLMMIGLIGLITGAIAIPQMIASRRDRSQKDMQAQIDQLREQIEAMQPPPS